MLNTRKVLFLQNSIMEIGECGGYLVALDNQYGFHIIHPTKLELIKSITLTKHPHYTHKYANSFGIEKSGQFFIPFATTKKGVVYNFHKEITKRGVITWHEQDIETATFSHDGKFLATGGQDGKVFLFDMERFKILTALVSRSDYISTISFSSDSHIIASSGFDKFTAIFDLTRNKTLHNLKTVDVVEKSVFFDDDRKIFMILRNGASIVYNILERKTESSENHFRNWPSALDISPDGKYCVAGTRSNAIYAIRTEDNVKLLSIELEYNGVGVVKFYRDMLLIGSIEGALMFIDYSVGADELECALKVKDFTKARKVIERNLFLTIHPMMDIFDEEWPRILKEAIAMLNGESINEAIALVEPFIVDERKRKEFDFYLMQKDSVAQFANAVAEKDFEKAYDMVYQNRYLEKSSAYTDLEAHWNKSLHKAKTLLEENATLNLKSATAVLRPFEKTIKKELIAHMLKNSSMFTQAEGLIKKRAFKSYFDLCEKNQFLKETELYKKVTSLGEKMMEDFIRYDKEQNFEKAQEIANVLGNFTPFKKSITQKMMLIKSKIELIDAIEKGKIKRAYELVESYEILKTLPEFKALSEDFLKTFDRCKESAYAGKPSRVLSCISTYMEIKYWGDKIASLMKIAYLNEIEGHVGESDINWELTVRRYVQRFGKDDEIKKTLKDAKLDKFLDAIEGEGDFRGYISRAYVDEITVYKSETAV